MTDQEIKNSLVTVDRETASNEFDRWARAMKLRLNRVRNENDKRDLEEDRAALIDLIMEGTAVVNERGQMLYNREDGDPLTFYRPRGQEIAEMDRKKSTDDIGKMHALIGAVTRTSPKTASTLYSNELLDCSMIVGLFLV